MFTALFRFVAIGDYGPGDQGAYQKFYAGKFSVVKWPVFNWKPYWNLPNVAKIIHFHGPKPADYHRYLRDNTTGNAMFDHLLKSSECHNEFSHCRQAIDLFDHFTTTAARERGQVNTRPLADDDGLRSIFAHTRDRLFLMFGISFALMAVNRILLTASVIPDESLTGLYVIRLISFVIILGAVLDKNLAPRRARRRAVRAAAQQRQAESHG